MPIKLYTEPRPAPTDIIPRYTPKDASAQPVKEELVFDGPTLEEWVSSGYDADRYPGAEAFMRKRFDFARRSVDSEAITDERKPAQEAATEVQGEPAHAITVDEHVTVE